MSNDPSGDLDSASWPATVSEAAARIVRALSRREKSGLASASDEDLYAHHFGLGASIRNNFGLWEGNTDLLDDCTQRAQSTDRKANGELGEAALFVGRMDVDGASHTILLAARDIARSEAS